MILGPFNLAETAAVTEQSGADAIDAHLITGGSAAVMRWPNSPKAARTAGEVKSSWPTAVRSCDTPRT
jgi:hypothetical protein